MKKDFKLLMQEILNSDFVNNINSGHLYNEEQRNILLDIQQSLVAVRFNNYLSSSEEKKSANICYIPRCDYIIAGCFPKELDDEMLNNLLNFKVQKDSLSDYHKKLIDSSPSTYKPIELQTSDEELDKRRFGIEIKETEDKITLTKTKRRTKNLYDWC